MEGNLGGGTLVGVLRAIGRQRKTGILTAQGAEEIIAFSFLNGAIVGADALNQSLEEGLGQVLASLRLVDTDEFARLAAEQEAGGGRVVDLLVERAYVSRGQLLESLRQHTYRLCLEALSWQTGEYRFYQGDEVAYEAGVPPLTVSELLVRASEDLGELGPLGRRLPGPEDIVRPTAPADASSEDPAGGHGLLRLLDGRKSLREVAGASGISDYDILDLAAEWLETGAVEIVGEPSPPRVPPSVPLSPTEPEPPPERLDSIIELDVSDLLEAPEPVTEPAERPAVFAPVPPAPTPAQSIARSTEPVARWISRGFGLSVLGAVVWLLVVSPERILLPFPWQASLRQGLESVQRSARRLEIQSGAHSFFLLYGRYPDAFEELESLGLVGDDSPRTTLRWQLASAPTSYSLQVTEGDRSLSSWTESIDGDFLLDPDFRETAMSAEAPPLVLLD